MDPRQSPFKGGDETVLLVGVKQGQRQDWDVSDSLEELAQLCRSAGGRIVGEFTCRQRSPHPAYYVGKGKAEEIQSLVHEGGIMTVVFDDDLTPAQGRNLEKITGAKIIDRTQVILDIFALHAHSKEGRLQIGLAQMEYLLPRLKRMWTHLERQRGGIGVRGGPGEQQIEVDRRRIQQRMVHFRKDLKRVRRHRAEQRRGRRRHGWALVCLVGYTNAGKSTLLNGLTGSDVETYDQLFATLDPTTRQIKLPNHQPALLTDTVGFIRKLPHHLVESFKATLEEVVDADILVHVVDASHPRVDKQIDAVKNVLRELGAHEKPVLTVFNKIDRAEGEAGARRLMAEMRGSVAVSALKGDGLNTFREHLADYLRERNLPVRVRIPLREGKLIAAVRGAGNILEEEADEEYLTMVARVPRKLYGRCEPYFMDKNEPVSYKPRTETGRGASEDEERDGRIDIQNDS